VTPGNVFQTNYNGQAMFIDQSKPIQGKLILYLGGIGAFKVWASGSGGFDAFVKKYFGGFHMFMPATDTGLDGGQVPQSYVTTLKTSPMDMEANRQIGDSRMELWDGVQRVNWYTVPTGKSIVEETVAAIKNAVAGADPGGDWGYFLDSTGNGLRTCDVWVVGYSWGSQTWAMISAYVPFGRVIDTSGPQDEGFPNALWITQPSANGTPGNRKYMLLGSMMPTHPHWGATPRLWAWSRTSRTRVGATWSPTCTRPVWARSLHPSASSRWSETTAPRPAGTRSFVPMVQGTGGTLSAHT
jgi:hypothetical protein